jgi:hypothetical protein
MNRSQSPRRWLCDKDELLRQRINPSQRQQSAQDEPQKYVYVRLSLQDIIIIIIVIVIIIITIIIIHYVDIIMMIIITNFIGFDWPPHVSHCSKIIGAPLPRFLFMCRLIQRENEAKALAEEEEEARQMMNLGSQCSSKVDCQNEMKPP